MSRASVFSIAPRLRHYPQAYEITEDRGLPPHSISRNFPLDHTEPWADSKEALYSLCDKSAPVNRQLYTFTHGASGIPKNPAVSIADDLPYYSIGCGEDSYFRRHDAMGVADGVGGWKGKKGANPALFSRKLMHYACLELEKYDGIEDGLFYDYYDVSPTKILERSYELLNRDVAKEGILGSSTACIVVLRDDELRIANLGDCGVSVIRQGDFVFRTEEQQHCFNYPYQLGTGSLDKPSDAQAFTVKVEKGDIVILGSDGIYDNLSDEDILDIVLRSTSGSLMNINPQKVSDALARQAKIVSEDSTFPSPFQDRAMQEGFYYQGGKIDDISVLVALVVDVEESLEEM
ncbi:protein serine/threonine phosphatase 2C [Basidiobolus meristosporus CBS 931.73]|uniref:Protein phosphatase n=1 Tax=Basidiobolus meristosporus CBS 931.73 TaxID=1314790 RepID=A0A1Y1YVM5_9FUNG|nr:protein serine/threonine phosphatase 2C [Basidiobolus meristosporus CBS 931.73]|eukprot:ORY02113.1 protein serine/threonine phosphatase 2C [Basidiobolus meristosporus CBS 931.73]